MPSPLRVLHVQKATGIGGSENHLLTLLARLDRARYTPALLVLEDPRQPADGFLTGARERGIPIDTLGVRGFGGPALMWRLARTYRRWRPDIVHTHLVHADVFGIPAARLAAVPGVVSSKHNDDRFRRGAVGKVDRVVSAMADRVIVISDHLKRFYREVEGIPEHKLTRIHYGLDADADPADRMDGAAFRRELGIPDDAPLAGVVARLDPQKGLPYLLGAFRRVRAALPAARLVVVGKGPLRAELEALTASLGLRSAVVFTGFRADIDRVMGALNLFVLPSLWEGFGLVLLEAMRAKKPIVASRVSAIPEIVTHEETGLLVPPADESALADAMLAILRRPDYATTLGRAGFARLRQHFGVDRMVRATADVYEAVAADTRRRRARVVSGAVRPE